MKGALRMKIMISDINMYCELSGNESGPWLVVLHGIKRYSAAQIKELSKHYRLLNIDLSGQHKDSISVASSRCSKIIAAIHILMLMSKLGMENAHFTGLDDSLQLCIEELFPGLMLSVINVTPINGLNLTGIINGLIGSLSKTFLGDTSKTDETLKAV